MLVVVVIVGVVAVVLLSGDDSDDGDSIAGGGPGAGPGGPGGPGGSGGSDSGDTYTVGDIAHGDVYDVTVTSVEDPFTPPDAVGVVYDPPERGHRYVAVDLSVTNTSDETQVFSVIANTAITDAEGQELRGGFPHADPEEMALDGDIAPGDTATGHLVYMVDDDITGLRFHLIENAATQTGPAFELASGAAPPTTAG